MKRLIITGAGGFLGRNVVKAILEQDIFDNLIAVTLGAEEMKARIEKNVKLSIFEADALKNHEVVLCSEDIVLNCAYPRAQKGADVTAGLDYIESVFELAAEAKVNGIINISSQSVYDPQRNHPAVESDMPILSDEYSIGKYCMEMLLRNICKDISYTNIRLASLIGPEFDVRVPNKMIKKALETGEITVEINQHSFGYLDVEDAARALIGLLKVNPADWKNVYNLGSDNNYCLLEMAEVIKDSIKELIGKDVSITMNVGCAKLNSSLDNSLLKSTIGTYQKCSFVESVKKITMQMTGISH